MFSFSPVFLIIQLFYFIRKKNGSSLFHSKYFVSRIHKQNSTADTQTNSLFQAFQILSRRLIPVNQTDG